MHKNPALSMMCTPKVVSTLGVFFMTRISINIKIKAVEEYLSGYNSKSYVARKYKIETKVFRILVGIYEIHGVNGLYNTPIITDDFRVNLIKWKYNNKASLLETCIHFAFRSTEAIVRWERLYNANGEQALLTIQIGRPHEKNRNDRRMIKTIGTRELIVADTERRFKKIGCLETASKKELSKVIIELRAKYRLIDLVNSLPISMSTFQYWQAILTSPINKDDTLISLIQHVFSEHKGNYGVRRVTAVIRKIYLENNEIASNHKKIQRIMATLNLKCTKYSKRKDRYDSSKEPNGKVVTILKDMPTNLGYKPTLHTDQGWQYQHRKWVNF